MLSEESKRNRQRQDTISLQITILAWSVEFIAGLIAISIIFISTTLDVYTEYYVKVDYILSIIVIPACYLIKTENVRQALYSLGWYKFFRDLLPNRNFRVDQAQDLEMNALPNRVGLENNESHNPEPINQLPSVEGMIASCDEDDENWLMRIDLFEDQGLPTQEVEFRDNLELNDREPSNESENDDWIYNINIFEDE